MTFIADRTEYDMLWNVLNQDPVSIHLKSNICYIYKQLLSLVSDIDPFDSSRVTLKITPKL